MTDAQIRLYALARVLAPVDHGVRVLRESIVDGEGSIYTIELRPPEERPRWFAIDGRLLEAATFPEELLKVELRRALAPPRASAGQPA